MSWYGTGRDFYRAGISIAFAIRSLEGISIALTIRSLDRTGVTIKTCYRPPYSVG